MLESHYLGHWDMYHNGGIPSLFWPCHLLFVFHSLPKSPPLKIPMIHALLNSQHPPHTHPGSSFLSPLISSRYFILQQYPQPHSSTWDHRIYCKESNGEGSDTDHGVKVWVFWASLLIQLLKWCHIWWPRWQDSNIPSQSTHPYTCFFIII